MSSGICECVDEVQELLSAIRCVGVEAHDDAGHHLHAVAVQRLDGFEDRHHVVVLFGHRLQRIGIGGFDAAEDRLEHRLAHQREDLGPFGDVERRLAGKRQRIAIAFLPFDEMRQKFADAAPMRDEIVVDEIDRVGEAAFHHLVEFGGDLLRCLEARIAAVQRRDVAELALIGTAAGELDAADEVFAELRELISRHRKVGQLAPHDRLQNDLAFRPRDVLFKPSEQLVGGVAHFADVEIVEVRVLLGTSRHRRAAQHHGAILGMGAAQDVLHLRPLHMHAADEHDFGPFEIVRGRRLEVLVDEADLPIPRRRCGDHEKALRRHESADAVR